MPVVYIPVPSTVVVFAYTKIHRKKDHNRQSVRKHLGVHLGRVPVHKHVPDTTTLMQTRLYARIKPSLSKILCVNCARGKRLPGTVTGSCHADVPFACHEETLKTPGA